MKDVDEYPRFLLDLINNVYEVPGRQELLTVIYRNLKEPFELSPSIALIPFDEKKGVYQLEGHALLPGPARWIEEWLLYYSKLDPLATLVFKTFPYKALRYSDVLSREDHFSSRLCKEFLAQIPASWVMTIPLACYGNKIGVIWLTRESREKDFGDWECALATMVAHHFAIALMVQDWRTHPPLEQNPGILVINERGHTIYRNEEMEKIFPGGMPDWIGGETPSQSLQLLHTERGTFRTRFFPVRSLPGPSAGEGKSPGKGRVVILEPYPPKVLLCQKMKELALSRRQSEIVLEIMRGRTNKEISEKLLVSLQTVKDHIHDIFRLLNIRNRSELILKVMGDLPFSENP